MLSEDGRRAIVDDLSSDFGAAAPGSKSGMELWETFHGANTIRFCGLAARSRAFVDHALLNPVLAAVADSELLPGCADYWLNTGQVMAVDPTSRPSTCTATRTTGPRPSTRTGR